jgi:hypothetical protein
VAKKPPHPVTPDGRYFVVRGRLWRMSIPALPEGERAKLVRMLSLARSSLRKTPHTTDAELAAARRQVNEAKVGLGERGAMWWTDGSSDYNWHLAVNTPYRGWYEAIPG